MTVTRENFPIPKGSFSSATIVLAMASAGLFPASGWAEWEFLPLK
jgi:hypothetical protein